MTGSLLIILGLKDERLTPASRGLSVLEKETNSKL